MYFIYRMILNLKRYKKQLIYVENNIQTYKEISQKKLVNKDFSIISNNCWVGSIYQKLIYHIHHQQWVFTFMRMNT